MITAPEEFFIDIEDCLEFFEDNWDEISLGTTTFADIVEHYKLNNSNR